MTRNFKKPLVGRTHYFIKNIADITEKFAKNFGYYFQKDFGKDFGKTSWRF